MGHLNVCLALTLTLVLLKPAAAAAKLKPLVHPTTTSALPSLPPTTTRTDERPVFYDREAETLKCKLLPEGCRLTELGASPENGADDLCPANATGVVSAPSYDEGWYVHCTCDEGLKPTGDKRTCLQIRDFGESCQVVSDDGGSVDPCRTEQHQICQHGSATCGCVEGRIRDTMDGRCKLKVGESCQRRDDLAEGPCTRFASCEGQAHAYAPTRARCECDPGYKATSNGTCVGQYVGASCLLDEDCPTAEQGLVCFNQNCECRHPRDQIYDWWAQKCMLVIGATCDPDAKAGAFLGCVATSTCSKTTTAETIPNATSARATGVCSCEVGHTAAVDNQSCHRILHNYGESCLNLDLLHPSPAGPGRAPAHATLVCDSNKGFACVNGSCGCAEPSAVYEPERDLCTVPVGGRCGQMEVAGSCTTDGGEKKCEHYRLPCGKDAYCDEEGRCKLHMLTYATDGELPLVGHRDEPAIRR